MKYFNFQQDNPEWGDIKYNSKNHPNATLATSGCGVLSVINALSNLYNINLSNVTLTLTNIAIKCGARELEGTNVETLLNSLLPHYPFIFTSTSINEEVSKTLKKYGVVICSTSGGKSYPSSAFSTGGHYVCVVCETQNRYIVADSLFYNNKLKSYGRSPMKKYENCYTIPKKDLYVASDFYYCIYPIKKEDRKQYFINSALKNQAYGEPQQQVQVGTFSKNQLVNVHSIYNMFNRFIAEVTLSANGKKHFCDSKLLGFKKVATNYSRTTGNLNAYSDPKKVGQPYKKAITIPINSKVEVLSLNTYHYNNLDVAKIRYAGKQYFVASKYLKRWVDNG